MNLQLSALVNNSQGDARKVLLMLREARRLWIKFGRPRGDAVVGQAKGDMWNVYREAAAAQLTALCLLDKAPPSRVTNKRPQKPEPTLQEKIHTAKSSLIWLFRLASDDEVSKEMETLLEYQADRYVDPL